MIVFVLLWFSRKDFNSAIFGHVSKFVTLVSFNFSAQ
jgi:hypothetical protein